MTRSDRPSVLSVEDEAMIAMELEDMLVDLGYEVLGPAATVAHALRLLRGRLPDAAIVDANLGGESAQPVADFLRARCVPFVLGAGYQTEELARLGLEGPLVKKPYAANDRGRALAAARAAQSGGGAPE